MSVQLHACNGAATLRRDIRKLYCTARPINLTQNFVDASAAIDTSLSPGQHGNDHDDPFGITRMLPLNQNSKYQSAKYGVKNGLEAIRTAVNFELVGIPYSRTRDPQQNLAQHIAGPKLGAFPISGRSCTITDCQSTQLHALIRMQANETSACLSDSKSTYRTHTKAKINRR